jgi:hypothetical protein
MWLGGEASKGSRPPSDAGTADCTAVAEALTVDENGAQTDETVTFDRIVGIQIQSP